MRRFSGILIATAVGCGGGTEPSTDGFATDSLRAITTYLQERVAAGDFPGGVWAVGSSRGIAYLDSVGVYGIDDPRLVGAETVYDLASLTKVIGLTTASYLLVAEETLTLETPVADVVPEFRGPARDRVTVRHLLTHTSGLPPWVPLHLETPDRPAALERIFAEPLQSHAGIQYSYSDLGAILMGHTVERAAGQSLDIFLATRVFEPLEMTSTRFNPPQEWRDRIAPTEDDPWRGRVVRGEVHDENAFHLGGVSGHAGLFSTAPDLGRFAAWLLRAHRGLLAPDALPYLPADLVRRFTVRQPGPEGSTRALGWDTPTPGGGASSGRLLSPTSFGHTGFTGTSIWIDPDKDIFIILLTNRVHPTRENRAVLTIRGVVADMVVRSLQR